MKWRGHSRGQTHPGVTREYGPIIAYRNDRGSFGTRRTVETPWIKNSLKESSQTNKKKKIRDDDRGALKGKKNRVGHTHTQH